MSPLTLQKRNLQILMIFSTTFLKFSELQMTEKTKLHEKPELVPVTTTTEFMIDDGLLSESTTKTTTTSTSSTSSTTTTLRSSTVKDSENIPTEPVTTDVRRMDGSKIIFSDKELEARNKDLANRVYLNVVPTRPTST